MEDERENIKGKIENYYGTIMHNNFDIISKNNIRYVNEFIDYVSSILDSNNGKEYLSGEFLDFMVYQNKGVPLYFVFDMLKEKVNCDIEDNEEIKDDIENINNKINDLRSKLVNLNYSNLFNPNDKLSDGVIDNILESNGCINILIRKKGDRTYVVSSPVKVIDLVEYRNGDYISLGDVKSNTLSIPLYQKDLDYIKTVESVKRSNDIYRLNSIVSKYFKSDKLPRGKDFYNELKDPNLNYDIRLLLYIISNRYSFNDLGNVAEESKLELDKIEILEEELEKDKIKLEEKSKQEEKEKLVKEAKERYKSKSLFWRMFNKKLNPDLKDFDSMDNEKINGMYR